MSTPLERFRFPVVCTYPDCDSGPLNSGDEIDAHITEEHLPESIWTFASEHMKEKAND